MPRFCLPSVSVSAVRGRVLLLLLVGGGKRGGKRDEIERWFWWWPMLGSLDSCLLFSVPLYSLLILFIARC